jgi:PAS domain S-box-containing protein
VLEKLRETTTPLETIARLERELSEARRSNEALRCELQSQVCLQASLLQSDERFRSLTAISVDWYWEQDEHLRFRVFNGGQLAGMRGPDRSVWLGRLRWELPGIKSDDPIWAAHRKVLEARQPFRNFEFERLERGELRCLSVSGEPVFDEQGNFTGYRGTGRDITEHKLKEDTLRLSMQFLHDIVENIPTAVQLLSVKDDYRFVMWNKAAEAMYGIPAHEAIGQTVHDLWPAEEAQALHRADRSLVASRCAQAVSESAMATRGRGLIRAHLRKVLLLDGAGEVAYLLVVADDITERLASESRLRKSEERFRGLTALSAGWYWEQDSALRFTHLSQKTSETPMGKTRWELDGVETDPAFWRAHRACLDRHETFHDFEYQHTSSEGKTLTVSISGEPIFDASGTFCGYRGVGTDITQRRHTEATLRASETRFRTVVGALVDAVVIRDREGRIVDCNPSAEQFFGRRLHEVRGQLEYCPAWQLFRSDGTPLGADDRPSTLARRTGQRQSDVLRYVTPAGRDVWVVSNVFPMFNEPGNGPSGYVSTLADITEIKQTKQEVLQLNIDLENRVRLRTAELETANKELETFSYSVAHDLRSPLNSIDGFSSLLQKNLAGSGGDNERVLHYLGRIRAGVRQMGELTDGLLELAQLSRANLQHERVDLGRLSHLVFAMLQERDPTRRVDREIQPGLVAVGDPALLRQVLDNLLGNAWKFTSKQAQAKIAVGSLLRPDGRMAFFVRDNGAGFDMAYADKLFGTFQRLHSPGEFSGTGIGLATVHRIITRHAGQIWAEASPGAGATFYFTLGPAVREGGDAAP